MGKPVKPGETLEFSGLKINFAETVHEEYNLAMKFEYMGKTFVYSGDMGYSETIIPFLDRVDMFLCEASLYDEQKGTVEGHLTASDAAQLASEAEVGRLILTHYPHYGNLYNLRLQAAQYYNGPIEMVKSGSVFSV